MESIEPSFKIDDKGRVICKNHSNYRYFVEPKDFFQDLYLNIELTCKTCINYKNNNCYFSKSRVDEIESSMKRRKFRCRLCGRKIERIFSIIQKLFYKETYDVQMPLICCECYDKILKHLFLHYSKKITGFYILNIFISVFFLFYFAFLFSIFNIHTVLYYLLIIPLFSFILFVVMVIIFKCIMKLRFTILGIQYYKKNLVV